MTSLEAQKHDPDTNHSIEIFSEIVPFECYSVNGENQRKVVI